MPSRSPTNTRNPRTPWDFIETQRFELLRLDDDALGSLARSYESATAKAFRELERVVRQIERALENGEPVHPNWLWRQQRWTSLLVQMGDEMSRFGGSAQSTIDRLGVTAAYMGGTHAATRLQYAAPDVSFDMLPREALDRMVANLRTRAPAGALLNGIAQTARNGLQSAMLDAMKTELTNGVAVGRNPRDVAKSIYSKVKDDVDGMTYRRAELIARTESMRMYRGAQTANYRNNDDVVLGWVWVAALNMFTCPACLAKHMSQHPLTEDMHSHPACRCTAMPFVDDEKPDLPFGDDWLREQPVDIQQRIMGSNERWRMWKDGEITLADCAKETRHPVWGGNVTVTPIRDLKRIAAGDVASRPNVVWNPNNDPISVPVPAKVPPPGPAPAPPKAAPEPEPPKPKTTLRPDSNLKGSETLDEFEATARKQSGPDGYESAAAYDRAGKPLFIKDGATSAVEFTDDEIGMLGGAVLSHNHPMGSSFSDAAVAFFIRNGLDEIRAVGERYTYRLTGTPPQIGALDRDTVAMNAYRRWRDHYYSLMTGFRNKVANGEVSADDAWLEHSNAILERLASEYGLKYERTPSDAKPRRFTRRLSAVFRRVFALSSPHRRSEP